MKHGYVLLQNAYGTEAMRKIWEERVMIQKWLDYEAAITEVQAEMGIVPQEAAREIIAKSSVDYLPPEKIAEIKVDAGHLIVSMIKAFAKMCGPAGEHFHVGPTTQDILDTGLTLQIKDAYQLLMKQLLDLEEVLVDVAERHKHTVMMGRTHGQHAVPLTFGFKVAIWATEIRDHIERLKNLEDRLFVAKLSAAVGARNTFAYIIGPEQAEELCQRVAERIGLRHPVIDPGQRTDRFAELASVLALLSSTLGEIGLEIRDLQRTEVGEVEEPWNSEKQYSSSTMPNKRNPEPSEWQEGLAKLARANAFALMDIQMQHERDATRMAVEFSCIPENFLLASAAVAQATRIFKGLKVHADRMKQNLYLQNGIAMSEVVMMELWRRTGQKVTAHTLVHDLSMKAFDERRSLRDVLLEDPRVRAVLSAADIDRITDPEQYVGTAALQVDRALAHIAACRRADGVGAEVQRQTA